jgi:MinD-like ATPase involved in chromosome partitioning or flagellar assembly
VRKTSVFEFEANLQGDESLVCGQIRRKPRRNEMRGHMTRIITIGSYRAGVGKSTIAANLAVQLAKTDLRIGLAELNFSAPLSQAILFGITSPMHSLAECVRGQCQPEVVGMNVFADRRDTGDLWVFPWMEAYDFTHAKQDDLPLYVNLYINRILQDLIHSHRLDVLLVDMDAGIQDFNLLVDATADCLVWVLRLDRIHYQGTAAMVEVARQALDIPSIFLIANEVLNRYDFAQVKNQLEEVYKTPAEALPLLQDVVSFDGILSLKLPRHPWSVGVGRIAARLI